MSKTWLSVAILLVAFQTALSFAEEAEEAKTDRVELTVVVPKDVPTFQGVLEARLYRYDPFLADVSADLMDLAQKTEFQHTLGKETKTVFTIGGKKTLDQNRRYYVTLFVLQNGKRTHMGHAAHRKGLCSVLTGGQPSEVQLTIKPVGQ